MSGGGDELRDEAPLAQQRPGGGGDRELYEELSRLNNDLATAQRELAKKNAELARANEQKNYFLGVVAHDLRNPLEVILTYSQFLAEDASGEDASERAQFIEIICRTSGFMLELVNDLLDVAKIEAGRLDLNTKPVDLAELVARNVARSRALAERKGVRIEHQTPPRLPITELDAVKIEQLLNNLVGNAVKFSSPGGRVTVGLALAGDELLLSVADEGPGIARRDLDRLFRPFNRGAARGTAGERNTGLGLAIAKKVVEGHGGRLWVESEEGRGTTFFVALPASRPEGEEATES